LLNQQPADHCCLLLQAMAALVHALEGPAAAPDSQQHANTTSSISSGAIEQGQPLLAVESVAAVDGAAAAAVATQSLHLVPAGAASVAAPEGPGTAAGSADEAQSLDVTELAAACIDAHSRGWQLVMQEMLAWVHHKPGHAQQQQQQYVSQQQQLQEQQLPEERGSVHPCREGPANPQQVCCRLDFDSNQNYSCEHA
jgi:hypothetical protein